MVFKRKTVVRGSFHQGDVGFGPRAGKQCVGNCVAYLCLSKGKAPEALKACDVDHYLNVGCDVYGQVSDFVGQEYLMFEDVPSTVKYGGFVYGVKCGGSIVGAIHDEGGLTGSFVRAFSLGCAVMFICSGSCVAVQFIGGQYFLFDSHSRDKRGLPVSDGCACVIAFVSFKAVVHHLYLLFGKGGNVQYEVVPVHIAKTKNKCAFEKRVICDLSSVLARGVKGKSGGVVGGVRAPVVACPVVGAETEVQTTSCATIGSSSICVPVQESDIVVGVMSGVLETEEVVCGGTDVGQVVAGNAGTSGVKAWSYGAVSGWGSVKPKSRGRGDWLAEKKAVKALKRARFESGSMSGREESDYLCEKQENNRKRNERRVKAKRRRVESGGVTGVLPEPVSGLGPRRKCYDRGGERSVLRGGRPKVMVESVVGKSGRTLYRCKEVLNKGLKRRAIRRDSCSKLFRDLAARRLDRSNARKLVKVAKEKRHLLKDFFKSVDYSVVDVQVSEAVGSETEGSSCGDSVAGMDYRLDCDGSRGGGVQGNDSVRGGPDGGGCAGEVTGGRVPVDGRAGCGGAGSGDSVNFSSVFADAKLRMNEGPIYVCCVCYIVLFSRSVVPVTPGRVDKYRDYLRPDFVGRADLFVCHSCRGNVDKNVVPKCSYRNGMRFPILPKVLDIHVDEEKLIALRIPFMQLRLLPRGGQVQLFGNVVNVPAEIERGVMMLPRFINDQGTVSVRIKRKLQYQGAYRRFNVRPERVLAALEYLMENSEIYRSADVGVNSEWLSHTLRLLAEGEDGVVCCEEDSGSICGGEEEDGPGFFFDISDDEEDALAVNNICEGEGQSFVGSGEASSAESVSPTEVVVGLSCVNSCGGGGEVELGGGGGVLGGDCSSEVRADDRSVLDVDSVSGEVDITVSPNVMGCGGAGACVGTDGDTVDGIDNRSSGAGVGIGCERLSSGSETESIGDEYSEVDSTEVGNCLSTLLDEEGTIPYLDIAPGERCKPLNLVYDEESEEMSFPTVYCGQRIKEIYPEGISFIQRCRWELRSDDRRVGKNAELIFFKYKKYQVLFIYKNALFALRYVKGGSGYKARDVMSDGQRADISCLDDGYYIYKKLRNSPHYLKAKRNELLGTIRQRGLPTFFVSLSSADSRWPGLIKVIAQQLYGREFSDSEVESMHYLEKCKILNSDPVTCARYFDNRFKEFLANVVYHESCPIGHVVDHFYRIEFQHRGSPHVHMLLFCDDCPTYVPGGSNLDLIKYVDQYISCSLECSDSNKPFVGLQVHRHSKTCRKDEKPVCRFGYPLPPFPRTVILQPNQSKTTDQRQNYKRVQDFLDSDANVDGLEFNDFLYKVGLSYADYVLAVRSSLKSDKVFLQRKPSESRVNMYMRNLLHVWEANVDCQYCLDAYSVVVYISNYINKQQRGLSMTMARVIEECKNSKKNIKETVKALGNVFLKSSEVSVQEAVYMLLGLPLTFLSRDVSSVCTKAKAERAKILVDKHILTACDPTDSNIFKDDKFDIYASRPNALGNWCLADYCCKINRVKLPSGRKPGTENSDNWLCHDRFYYYKKRAKDRVLLYYCPSETSDVEEYYRVCALLFLPWWCEDNILGECCSYVQLFENLSTIERNDLFQRKQYYNKQNVEFIAQASEGSDGSRVAPNCSEVDLGDKALRSIFLSDSRFFSPPKLKDFITDGVDPGGEGISGLCVHRSVENLWPQSDYLKAVNALNNGQRRAHDYVIDTCVKGDSLIRLFITGGAGTGKTKLLLAMYQGLSRFYNLLPHRDPSKDSVLRLAFTGKAAYLIGGETVHSGLQISPLSSYTVYEALSSDKMNTLRVKLSGVRVIMFDEVSLIGCNFFNFIDRRLQDVFGCTESFGGLHVVAFGDLYQLPPVRDQWIFSDVSRGVASLSANVWRDEFQMVELNEIMRQKDDVLFAQVLNRVREGKQTPADVSVLQGASVSRIPSNNHNSLFLFPTNREVDSVNSIVYDNSNGEKCIVKSVDKVVGDCMQYKRSALEEKVRAIGDSKCCLLYELQLCVGLTYDLVHNVNVEDGLANGCSGILRYIQFVENYEKPAILWLEFVDENIGILQRSLYKNYCDENVNTNWTPVFAVTTQFSLSRGGVNIYRSQFPLKQATAKTVHKSQGSTVDEVVVDISSGLRMRQLLKHSAYVALSRVTSLSGLTIVNFDERQIVGDDSVKAEMDRLRASKLLYHDNDFNVDEILLYYQNVQHLVPHRECLSKDLSVKHSIMTFVNETRISSLDTGCLSLQANYNCYRFDVTAGVDGIGAGLMILVKKPLDLMNLFKWRCNRCEVLIGYSVLLGGFVGVFYCSPRARRSDINDMFQAVQSHVEGRKIAALVGDLNIDKFLSTNRNYVQVIAQMLSCYDIAGVPTTRWGTSIDCWFSNVSASINSQYLPWSHHFGLSVRWTE